MPLPAVQRLVSGVGLLYVLGIAAVMLLGASLQVARGPPAVKIMPEGAGAWAGVEFGVTGVEIVRATALATANDLPTALLKSVPFTDVPLAADTAVVRRLDRYIRVMQAANQKAEGGMVSQSLAQFFTHPIPPHTLPNDADRAGHNQSTDAGGSDANSAALGASAVEQLAGQQHMLQSKLSRLGQPIKVLLFHMLRTPKHAGYLSRYSDFFVCRVRFIAAGSCDCERAAVTVHTVGRVAAVATAILN